MNNNLPKIIAIVGTNASGKSAIGIELAKIFNGEIISADSRQIYRGFDLCSGKITAEEKRSIPHHMLDIKDIGEPFSVFEFQRMAYSLIPQILSRGKTPFIVGGAGLYIRSVVEGFTLNERPPDASLRGELEKLSVDELKAMLPPEARAFLDSNPSDSRNIRRIIPLLEKIRRGESWRNENNARYNALQLGITWPKEVLHKRIDERLALRIEQGMIGEVEAYLDNGGRSEYLRDLGLEYRYILEYLTGEFQSQDEFKLKLAQAIKRFAKRQMTWFRPDDSIRWIDMSADYIGQARSLVSDFLDNH